MLRSTNTNKKVLLDFCIFVNFSKLLFHYLNNSNNFLSVCKYINVLYLIKRCKMYVLVNYLCANFQFHYFNIFLFQVTQRSMRKSVFLNNIKNLINLMKRKLLLSQIRDFLINIAFSFKIKNFSK